MSVLKLYARQTMALTRKCVKLQLRNKSATATQLLIGVLFLTLLLVMDVALRATNNSNTYYRQEFDPPTVGGAGPDDAIMQQCVARIPLAAGGEPTCYSFIYAPFRASQADIPAMNAIVLDIATRANLPTVDGATYGTRRFENTSMMEAFLLTNDNITKLAVTFENSDEWSNAGTKFKYQVQVNNTKTCTEVNALGCDSPMLGVAIPFQTAVDAAFAKLYAVSGNVPSDPQITASFADFPHPDMPALLDVVAQFGQTFMYIAITFNYVIQLTLVVQEKEDHLVESMRQMGMRDLPYWSSWFIVNTAVNTIMVLLLIGVGNLYGLDVFTENAFGLMFSLLWLSSMAFTGLAFFFSTLARTTSTARLFGIATFVITFIASPILVGVYYSDGTDDYNGLRVILARLPFMSFYQIIGQLIAAASGSTNTGMTWDERQVNLLPYVESNTEEAIWTLEMGYLALIEGFLIFAVLTWYLDHVLASEYGKRDPVYFFLKPILPDAIYRCTFLPRRHNVVVPYKDESADVAEEREIVANKSYGERKPAVVIDSLFKTYGSFNAVNNISYAVDENECFVLLGHNGAGKSTTLSMLTGLTDVSRGDATVFGHSIKTDMGAISGFMGVCPQHDVLWDQLSGREHLEMFADLKGIPSATVEEEVNARLADVLLTEEGANPAGSYSGGMKRRLSIAIALLGNPRIIYLDEPTTGMDPVTRRSVWDMIQRAKKGRVIILTTHSMEEADILGDRIGVMSKGRLQAVGNSLRLKATYGSGYRMTMFVDNVEHKEQVKAFVDTNAPKGTVLGSDIDGALLFQLPRQENSLDIVPFFAELEEKSKEMGVSDFSIGLTTLEEVFLNLSAKDHFIEEKDNATPTPPVVSEPVQTMNEKEAKALGIWSQIVALTKKSWRYQLKNRLSCCFVLCYPLFIMLLLMLVESSIFAGLRWTILCGDAVTSEGCIRSGIDLECVADLYSRTYASEPTLQVGIIVNSGRTGGINPNCDSEACFEGLEQPNFAGIPSYSANDITAATVGGLDYSSSETNNVRFVEWEANLKFLLKDRSCQTKYDRHFETSDNPECTKQKLNARDCATRVRELEKTKDYLDKEAGSEDAGTGGCSRTFTGGAFEPTSEYVAEVELWDEELNTCEIEVNQVVWSHFNDTELNSEINSVASRNSSDIGSGLLSSFSTRLMMDPDVSTLVLKVIYPVLAGLSAAGFLDFDPWTLDIHALVPVVCTNSVALNMMASVIGDATDGKLITNNFCGYLLHMDHIRGTSFENYETEPDFRVKGFYDQWFGKKVETALMEERAETILESDQKYHKRTYKSQWSGYNFHSASGETGEYNYTAYYNNSGSGDTRMGNWQSLVWLMNSAIVSSHTGGREIGFKTRTFPTRFECNRDEWLLDSTIALKCDLLPSFLQLSILDFVSISLFPYILMIHMFIVVSLIVYEKENRLRMIMKMMGLNSGVYWGVNYMFYFAQYMGMAAMMYLMGQAAGLQMFLLHSPGLVWLYLFSWGNLMVVFSFFLSIFFKSTRTSTAVIFLMMLIMNTTGANLLENLVFDPNLSEDSLFPLMIFPPLVMIRALLWLGVAGAFKETIDLGNWTTYANGNVATSIMIMWLEWFALVFLVWYLDQVWVVGFGVAKHPLFIFDKNYWSPPKQDRDSHQHTKKDLKDLPVDPVVMANGFELEADAIKEHERVVDAANLKSIQVRVARLHKRYENGFVAVKSISLGINKRECFGLLGHNGAGKTTTLNMLCGLFEPTSGDARIGDADLSIKTDLPLIHGQMGVCPQHDVLWNSLSAKDHLNFYGRLKGLKGVALTNEVEHLLRAVNLHNFQNRRAGAFSGGMKRRLSVAISLIGNPTVVYMDEPSTGLDPASRRQLWDVINHAKGNKSIILTTHSMEEADVLCDRIGIMAAGELQCLGVAAQLKKRYGEGFTCAVTTAQKDDAAYKRISDLVTGMFPSAKILQDPMGGTSVFEVKREEVKLSKVFAEFEACKAEYGITDWGITETSLEEVFLKLAQHAHEKEMKQKHK